MWMGSPPRFGAKAAMMIVCVVSGVVHELVVTVPARGGYGGPTLYFALQGLAVWLECGCPLRSPFLWRLRTFAFVLLPLPIAFPAPFVTNVCQPFFENLGALP
jgi:alginate O-acetyltransferase complex protein AlgI